MFHKKQKKINEYYEITDKLTKLVNVSGIVCPFDGSMFSNRREYGRAVVAWAYAVQNAKEVSKKKK